MIEEKQHKKLSKFLSLILRHKPEEINIELDENGWANTKDLIAKMNSYGKNIDIETLEIIVKNNDKQRFSFNNDKSKIRANQGHSIKIDLNYSEQEPPEFLYHGTAKRFLDNILKNGLEKQKRHHVHLSSDITTANSVGKRHGVPVVLKISSKQMYNDGFIFYKSKNGVWLTENVPIKYINTSLFD